jgi:hypothetical protein
VIHSIEHLEAGSLFRILPGSVAPVPAHLMGVVRCTFSTSAKFEGLCWCYTCSSSFNLEMRPDSVFRVYHSRVGCEFERRYLNIRRYLNPGPECSLLGTHHANWWRVWVQEFERIL